jgi:hypothetical protein
VNQTGDADGIEFGFLPISCPDGRDHLVDERVLATSPDGRYRARCGEYVLSAALCTPPGRLCALCVPRSLPATTAAASRAARSSRARLHGFLAPIRALRSPRLRAA